MTEPLEKTNESSDSAQKGIPDLKKELQGIYTQKEEWFKKKEDLKKQLHEFIAKAKELQSALHERNSEIEKLKKERDIYNTKVRELVAKIKKFNKVSYYHPNTANIKKEIEGLEKKIEFMAVDFSKEKQMTKKLKDLQKKYFAALEEEKASQEVKNLSNEIDAAKKTSNEMHKKILDMTHAGNDYKTYVEVSRNINRVKKEQEQAFAQFINYKNKYMEITNLLKKKLVLEQRKLEQKPKKKESVQKGVLDLAEKRRLIEEKMRRGKKLTTEDLLVFQGVEF